MGVSTGLLLIIVVAFLIAFGYAAPANPAMERVRRVLTAGLLLLLLIAFLIYFRVILIPFVVPLLIAYLLDPVLDRLQDRGLSRVGAILLVYGLLLWLFLTLLVLIGPPLTRQVTQLVQSLTSEDAMRQLNDWIYTFTDRGALAIWIERQAERLRLPSEWVDSLQENIGRVTPVMAQAAAWVGDQLQSLIGWLFGTVASLAWLLLLPITLYYSLRDFDPLRRRLYYLLAPEYRLVVGRLASDINVALGGYLRGYAVLCLLVGVVQTTALFILDGFFEFDYELLLGILAGATYFIPYIASLTSTILSALVIYFTGGHSVPEMLIGWAVLQGINSVFDNVVTPRIVGQKTGIHPLIVMFALLAGGKAFGLLGVLLAAPLAVCAKILLQHFFPRLSSPIPIDKTPEVELMAAGEDQEGPPPTEQPEAAGVERVHVPPQTADGSANPEYHGDDHDEPLPPVIDPERRAEPEGEGDDDGDSKGQ